MDKGAISIPDIPHSVEHVPTMLAFASVSPRVAPAASSRAGARRPGAPAGAPSRLRVRVRATPTEEPTDEDFVLFNSMLASGDIPKAIRDAAVEGKLTPATLGAAYVVFDKCKSLEEDAPVLKTLESVITLITQTLQQLNATPAVRLIDELMTIDPTAEAEAVRAKIAEAYAAKTVSKDDLHASLQMMVEDMASQDEAWEKHVAQAATTTDKEEFEQLIAHANGRMEAKRRLSQLQAMSKE